MTTPNIKLPFERIFTNIPTTLVPNQYIFNTFYLTSNSPSPAPYNFRKSSQTKERVLPQIYNSTFAVCVLSVSLTTTAPSQPLLAHLYSTKVHPSRVHYSNYLKKIAIFISFQSIPYPSTQRSRNSIAKVPWRRSSSDGGNVGR